MNINVNCAFFSIKLSFSTCHQFLAEFPRILNSVYLSYLDLNIQLWRHDFHNSCQELNNPVNIRKQNLIFIAHIHFSIYIVRYLKITKTDHTKKLVAQKITLPGFLEATASILTTRQFFVSVQPSFNS